MFLEVRFIPAVLCHKCQDVATLLVCVELSHRYWASFEPQDCTCCYASADTCLKCDLQMHIHVQPWHAHDFTDLLI